jgi:hypothetical protein
MNVHLNEQQFQSRYQLSKLNQGRALKKYVHTLRIPLSVIDEVYEKSSDASLDTGKGTIDKREFLAMLDVGTSLSLSLSLSIFFFFFFQSQICSHSCLS